MNTEKKERIIKGICLVISFILIIVIVILGSTDIKKTKEDKDKEKDEEIITEIDKYVEHVSYDNNFVLKTPENWKEVSKHSLNKNAIIELNHEATYSYVLVAVNSKKAMNESFSSYKKRIFAQKEDIYKTKIKEKVDVVIDGKTATYAKLYYTNPDKINVVIRSYAFETKNYYGQMVMWTTKDNEQKLNDVFDNISKTLKEEKVDNK